MIIQRLNSGKNRNKSSEIQFWIVGKHNTTISHHEDLPQSEDLPKHIYFDWQKFWTDDANCWTTTGFPIHRTQQQLIDTRSTTPFTKQVTWQAQQFHHVVLINYSVFDKQSIHTQLKHLINLFEPHKDSTQRVYIGINGKRTTCTHIINSLLKGQQNKEAFKNRFLFFRNIQTYKRTIEEHNITHVIDDRFGYINKVYVAGHHYRNCFHFNKSKDTVTNLRTGITRIQNITSWDQLLTQLQFSSHKETEARLTTPIASFDTNPLLHYTDTRQHELTLVMWNTNSLRSVHRQGHLLEFLHQTTADIIGFTELRSSMDSILSIPGVRDILERKGFRYTYWNPSTSNVGQYGTAILSRIRPKEVIFNMQHLDDEGRIITLIFDEFIQILSYTPTMGIDITTNDLTKTQRRYDFDRHLSIHCDNLKAKHGLPILLAGDLNICLAASDIWDPKIFRTQFPSCSPIEVDNIHTLMNNNNLVSAYDTFPKHISSHQNDRFTFFFNQRHTQGMKIDHFLTPKEWFQTTPNTDSIRVTDVQILHNQLGSDHLPISMTLHLPQGISTHHTSILADNEELIQSKHGRKASQTCLSFLSHLPVTKCAVSTSPFNFAGIAFRSPLIKAITTATSTDAELHQIVSNCVNILAHLHSEETTQADPTTPEPPHPKSKPDNEERIEQAINNTVTTPTTATHRREVYIPHVTVNYFDNPTARSTMLDTGANNCLMGISDLQDLLGRPIPISELTPADIILRVGDTKTTPVLGSYPVPMLIGGTQVIQKHYIMSTTSFGTLLGMEFFHQHHACIDIQSHTFSFFLDQQGNRIVLPFFDKAGIKSIESYSLYATEELLLHPGHSFINTALSSSHRPTFSHQFGAIQSTPHLTATHNLLTSEGFTYLKSRGRNTVLLLNTSSEPIRIKRGTPVAQYVPMTPDEYCANGEGFEIDTELLANPDITPLPNWRSQTNYTTPQDTLPEQHCLNTQTLTPLSPPVPQDYTLQDGFKDILPSKLIPDYTSTELALLYDSPGLKDVLPQLDPNLMHVPGPPTVVQLDRLKQILAKRRAVFSKDTDKPIHVKHYTTTIPHNNKPTCERIRPYTAIEVQEWKKHVSQLLDSGTVEYSTSPWRSSSFLVKKPSGDGYRFVTDYRKANMQVPKQHWPLVRIDAALSALGNAKVISSCDANAAYHQIPLGDESSKEFTSFVGPTCQLQYTTLPQGYKNSVSEYSKFTSTILGELQWQCCLTYLDDFLIWSTDYNSHLDDLDKVFCRLEYYGVQLSPKKTLLCRKELPYLGHVIEPGVGIKPNPKLIESILSLPYPANKRKMKTFLQKCGFYRKMIPLYSTLIAPLQIAMNSRSMPKTPTENQQLSFTTLRQCLIEGPIIAMPDLDPNSKPFYVITDASKYGIAGILLQKGDDGLLHPIFYASRTTTDSESTKYSQYQLEMAAIVWSLGVFKPYLRHKAIPFTLQTDCSALLWLMKTESSLATKWVWKLTEFDFTIHHLKGSLNPADIISREPLPVPPGYYDEQLVDPLYTTKHSKIMQLIIDTINARQRTDTDQPPPTQPLITTQHLNTCQTFLNNNYAVSSLNTASSHPHTRSQGHLQPTPHRTSVPHSQPDPSRATTRSQSVALRPQQPIPLPTSQDSSQSDLSPTSQDSIDQKHIDPTPPPRDSVLSQTPQSQEEQKEAAISIRDFEFKSEADELLFIEQQDSQLEAATRAASAPIINNDLPIHTDLPLDEQIHLINTELSLDNIRRWQKEDPQIQKILTKLGSAPAETPIHKLYNTQNDLLYISNVTLKQRTTTNKNKIRHLEIRNEHSLVIPSTTIPGTNIPVKWAILRWYHGLPVSGHGGVIATYGAIRQSYYWPNLIKDVKRWIAACHPCQRRKFSKPRSMGQHRSVLHTRPFEAVSIDLVGPFPINEHGNMWILTIVDHFTRYPITVPIPDKTQHTVMEALKTHLFLALPFWPRRIISDKGGEFVNGVIQKLYKQIGVRQVLTSADNPQANQGERFHRYMNAAISLFLGDKTRHTMWEQFLDCATYVYRCTINTMTGMSPFFALYGRHPDRPLDFILNTKEEKFATVQEYTQSITGKLHTAYKHMHDNQTKMALKNQRYDERKTIQDYTPGQFVWIWKKHAPTKLEWRFEGPHTVVSKTNANSYVVKIDTHMNRAGSIIQATTKNVSIRHLRPYNPWTKDLANTSPQWMIDTQEDPDSNPITRNIEVGDYCIVPCYTMYEIEATLKQPFLVGQVETTSRTDCTIRLFGNNDLDPYGPQLPGWIELTRPKDTSSSTQYTARCDFRTIGKPDYIPYSSHMSVTDKYFHHTKIAPHLILYYGFQLDPLTKKTPPHILKRISQDEWINFDFD